MPETTEKSRHKFVVLSTTSISNISCEGPSLVPFSISRTDITSLDSTQPSTETAQHLNLTELSKRTTNQRNHSSPYKNNGSWDEDVDNQQIHGNQERDRESADQQSEHSQNYRTIASPAVSTNRRTGSPLTMED